MAIRRIIETPNPLLREKSLPVDIINEEINSLLDDMVETMYDSSGAGLAAIQVGVKKRIFIVDVGKKEQEELSDLHFFINPKITFYSEEHVVMPEGCLSFPGGKADISRPEKVVVEYMDRKGEQKQMAADDWLARAIQHEHDHIEGILLIDRVSKIKKDLLLKKVHKTQKDHE
jgi:peptide deformylase